LPARIYSGRHPSCQGSDYGSCTSEPSTAASSTGSSPHASHPSKSPASRSGSGTSDQNNHEAEHLWFGTDWNSSSALHVDRRRSLSQRLQQKLQERQSEWQELGAEGEAFVVGKARAGISARHAVAGGSHRSAADVQAPDDWYSPPDEYTWCDTEGTAYTFATNGENERPSSGSFRRRPQDYAFQFRRGEQRTNPKPPQDSGRQSPNQATSSQPPSPHKYSHAAHATSNTRAPPPVSATPPRQPKPPINRTVYGCNSPRRDHVPPMHIPGARQTSGAGWRSSFWSNSGSHSTAWSSPKSGCAPPPPQTEKPPPPSSRPTAPATAAALSTARTQLEARVVQGLEVRLQELKRVPRDEQRKASKELLVQWHPDKNPERGEEATRVFQWLQNRRKEVLGF